MPKLYTDANPTTIAYYLDGGHSGYQKLSGQWSSMQAEYLAIMYGLTEYFNKWQKELDARWDNVDGMKVGSPSDRTKRPSPPAVLVCCDNEVVVKQLRLEYHIGNEGLRKLAVNIWKMCENVEVKFEWIPRKDNLAGMLLK